MNKSRIIISDPHGCYKTLMALIAQFPPGVSITFAGDLIDRGFESSKIVKFVRENGHDCVRGNHEQMMIEELQFETTYIGEERPFADEREGIWLMNGGDATMYSYLTESENSTGDLVKTRTYDIESLKKDLEWMKTLPYFLEYKELVDDKGQHLLVTHSTAAEVWDERNNEDLHRFYSNILWERKAVPKKIKGIFNIYGHTPQKTKALVRAHFACIDTGACFNRGDYGKMTGYQFPEGILYVQKNIEGEDP